MKLLPFGGASLESARRLRGHRALTMFGGREAISDGSLPIRPNRAEAGRAQQVVTEPKITAAKPGQAVDYDTSEDPWDGLDEFYNRNQVRLPPDHYE